MTTNDGSTSVFARYIDSPKQRPAEPEVIRMGPAAATIPPADPKAHPTEKFLSWLLNHWSKPEVSLREICRFGPHDIRDWERAMDMAETLVQRGWLVRREKQKRRDMRVWQILRGPSATLPQSSPRD